MRFSQQTKNDLMQVALWLGLFISILFLLSLTVSRALSVSLESARHLVASVGTISMLAYILRDLLSVHWRAFMGVSAFVLLLGAYGALSELYVINFTILGIDELPPAFNFVYLAVTIAALMFTVYTVKNDISGYTASGAY